MAMWWDVEFYRDVLHHHDYGTMINSGAFTGTPGDVAKAKVSAWLAERGIGKAAVNYRIRDWLISRQRYWGCADPDDLLPTRAGSCPCPTRTCR